MNLAPYSAVHTTWSLSCVLYVCQQGRWELEPTETLGMCVPAEGFLIVLRLWDPPSDRNRTERVLAEAESASICSSNFTLYSCVWHTLTSCCVCESCANNLNTAGSDFIQTQFNVDLVLLEYLDHYYSIYIYSTDKDLNFYHNLYMLYIWLTGQ